MPGASDVQAATLAVRYRAGDQQTYRMHIVFTGAVTLASGQIQPATFDMRAAETTGVSAVDPDGTATLEVQLTDVTGISNGQPLPPLGTQKYQVKVAPDGQIVSGVGPSQSIPAADQSFAILPDHKVKPGDGWTLDFERPNPVGSGSLKVHAVNRLLRYEQVAGVRAAVVRSQISTPFDLDIDPAKLGTALGQPAPPAAATLHETGSVTADVTSWVDAAAGRFVKSSAQTRFDLTATLGQAGSSVTYKLAGSDTSDLERQS